MRRVSVPRCERSLLSRETEDGGHLVVLEDAVDDDDGSPVENGTPFLLGEGEC